MSNTPPIQLGVPVSPSNINAYAASRASPRDRMKIDRLLSSPRSPWSPRFGMREATGPQRFTNCIDSSHLKKPRKTPLTKSVAACTSPARDGRPEDSARRRGQESASQPGHHLTKRTGSKGDAGASSRSSSRGAGEEAADAGIAEVSRDTSVAKQIKDETSVTNAGIHHGREVAEEDGVQTRPRMNSDVNLNAKLLLSFGSSSSMQEERGEDAAISAVLGGGASLFPVPLIVVAVTDGKLESGIPKKSLDILEQIIKKLSKESNMTVTLLNEGKIDLHLRVFASNSQEARALREYVKANPNQRPAPFVILATQLPMAVMYDPKTLNPQLASAADRLRKQAKTRATKLLRELLFDPSGQASGEVLGGHKGPMSMCKNFEEIIDKRCVQVEYQDKGRRFIVFPAIVRGPTSGGASLATGVTGVKEEDTRNTAFSSVSKVAAASSDRPMKENLSSSSSTTTANASIRGSKLTLHRPSPSVEELQPPEPSPRHFPVSLMVIAIGDGELLPCEDHKTLHRLQQVMSKVPKEHHLTVDLPNVPCLALRMRLFVVNSEDAKAASEYMAAHPEQRPAPFVLVASSLPVAVSYNATVSDVSDSNVVDCLRKQAKTRAVKLIRQTMSKKVIGVTQQILRGHEGALCLAEMMRGPLMEHATVFSGGKRFIAFAARARAGHEQVGGLRGANRPSSGAVNEAGEFSGPEGQNLFSGLESLASAATMSLDDDKQWEGSGDGEGAVGRCKGPQLSQRRLCELCGKGNEGSYGTGRFCSKACRYEAHALKVAQHRKGGGGGSRKAAGSRPIPARSIFEKGAAVADEEGCAEMEVEGEGDRKWDFSKNDWA